MQMFEPKRKEARTKVSIGLKDSMSIFKSKSIGVRVKNL